MTYSETLRYLESFINYEKLVSYHYKESLKLERIRDFLCLIHNPQDALKCIHIAGTKGKGSTCAFLAYILREAGFKTGLYTSPHLSDFRERIRILKKRRPVSGLRRLDFFEGMVPKEDLRNLVNMLKPQIDKYNRHGEYGPLTFFEVYTAMAFVYFKEENVDYCVLETGLGGRLDATNVVNPLASGITSLSYEHTQKLGKTLKQIASEKAGIIKPYTVTVSAPQEKAAIEVIREKCAAEKCRLYELGKDITYKKNKNGFSVKAVHGEHENLKINLIGDHQLTNAALAVGLLDVLNIPVSSGAIKEGLYNTKWPARCEVISRHPLILLDGAQNVASSRALADAIRNNFKYKNLILVLGISNDKDIKGVCHELSGLADYVILTRADNARATDPQKLVEHFKNKRVFKTESVKEAKPLAIKLAEEKDLVLVTGSLFVAGEFRC